MNYTENRGKPIMREHLKIHYRSYYLYLIKLQK